METMSPLVRRDNHLSAFMSECSQISHHQSTGGSPMTKARRPKSADGSNTRPLHSSPLARPALNRSLVTPTAPTLAVSSSDPLLMITTPPVCHVLNPKSCQCLDSSTQPFCDSCSVSPATFKRSSGPITAGLRSSGRSQSLYQPSTSDGRRAISARTVAAPPEWEIDPLQSLMTSRTPKSHLRPRSSSGLVSSFRPPIPTVEEEADWQVEIDSAEPSALSSPNTSRNSSTSEFAHPRSASQDNSWYTKNTYDVTPRFSRLGLSASTVVMPLSPKEHRRLSRNASLAKSNSTSTNTNLTSKHFFIPSSSKSPPPTRISLQPPKPSPQVQPPPLLSRTSSTTSSFETSSIASTTSPRQTPTPVSTSTSAPSLTRSRNSEDSISTWYESCPPATPLLERDLILPVENDGEECVVDKGDGVDEFRDRDHDHDYSDVTITLSSDSGNDDDDVTRPGQAIEQSETPVYSELPQPNQTHTFPKDVKKGRDCIRKKLVRIKLQRVVDVDDLDDASFSTANLFIQKTTSTTTITMTPVSEAGRAAVGLQVPPAIVTVSAATVVDSQDTLVASVPVSPPTLKKKRSTFRSILKALLGGGNTTPSIRSENGKRKTENEMDMR